MGWLARRITRPRALLTVLFASFGVLLGCAIAAGKLLALAERPNGSTAFDSSITSWVVDHRTGGLTTFARVLSTLGSQVVLIPIVAIVVVALLRRRELVWAAFLIAGWGGALLLYNLTKHFVHRPRPPRDIWLTNVGRSTSFPSGHATQSLATFVALAVVATLWVRGRRWPGTTVAVVLAAAVGWSRVYLGVHWTTDVLAGWLIAGTWIGVVTWLAGPAERLDWPRRSPIIRNG